MGYILITGAGGFIGKALCEKMLTGGWQVRGTERLARQAVDANVRRFFYEFCKVNGDGGKRR